MLHLELQMKLNEACTADEHHSYRIILIRRCIACNVCLFVCLSSSVAGRQTSANACAMLSRHFMSNGKFHTYEIQFIFVHVSVISNAFWNVCVAVQARMRSYFHKKWIRRWTDTDCMALMCWISRKCHREKIHFSPSLALAPFALFFVCLIFTYYFIMHFPIT